MSKALKSSISSIFSNSDLLDWPNFISDSGLNEIIDRCFFKNLTFF